MCDIHCTCIHNATRGICIPYPTTGIPYIPDPKPEQMCTCEYKKPRPAIMQPVTRGRCLSKKIPFVDLDIVTLFFHIAESCSTLVNIPLYQTLFRPLCSIFCAHDCVCAHGFTSGSCVEGYCICNGDGPSYIAN